MVEGLLKASGLSGYILCYIPQKPYILLTQMTGHLNAIAGVIDTEITGGAQQPISLISEIRWGASTFFFLGGHSLGVPTFSEKYLGDLILGGPMPIS